MTTDQQTACPPGQPTHATVILHWRDDAGASHERSTTAKLLSLGWGLTLHEFLDGQDAPADQEPDQLRFKLAEHLTGKRHWLSDDRLLSLVADAMNRKEINQ